MLTAEKITKQLVNKDDAGQAGTSVAPSDLSAETQHAAQSVTGQYESK